MRVSLILLCSALLLACSTRGHPIDVDSIPKIQPGVTTQDQVDRWFGQPNTVSLRGRGGSRWVYEESEQETRSTRFLTRMGRFIASLFGYWTPVAPMDVTYTNTITHRLAIDFDASRVVIDYTYDRHEMPTHSVH